VRTSWSCDRTLIRTLLGDDDGDDDPADPAAVGRRLRELATDPADSTEGVRFTARVLSGNLRLLVGMVWTNRPWRLVVRLSRALTAAIAAGVFALAGSLLLVVPALFTDRLGHPARAADYLELAWLISSLATVGGALGAGLESDEAVRQAAYSYRPDRAAPEAPPG
jgi:hypothetical protein